MPERGKRLEVTFWNFEVPPLENLIWPIKNIEFRAD
jgi:hypothetical protein